MRVALISHGYAPRIGGAERQLGAIAPILKRRGVEVAVFTRRLANTRDYELVDEVPVYRFPVPGPKALAAMTFSVLALAEIKRFQPDLIHAHELISPATTAWMANRFFNIPFIITPHSSGVDGDVERLKRKFLGATRLASFRRDAFAFVTISAEIDRELEAIGVPAHQKVAIGNGVDTARFAPVDRERKQEIRDELGLPDHAPVAVFVGRLVPVKRLDLLVGLWPKVREKYRDAILLIVGDGPLESRLKTAETEGVRFLGSRDDISTVLQAADLFLLASDSEGQPVSLLEAMACEIPCVATRVGGIPDVLTHEYNGLLVPPGDPEAYLEAVFTLLDQPAWRDRIGKKGRERILQKYSHEDVASQLMDLYQRCIECGRKP